MIGPESIEEARRLMRPGARVAWTGGSRPATWGKVGEVERVLVALMYVEQVNVWEDYWRETASEDVRAIFWHRARGDAHATLRAQARSV